MDMVDPLQRDRESPLHKVGPPTFGKRWDIQIIGWDWQMIDGGVLPGRLSADLPHLFPRKYNRRVQQLVDGREFGQARQLWIVVGR